MPYTTPDTKIEEELRQLTLAYEQIGKQLHEKNNELLQSNKLLKAEIVERKKIEAEILEITQEEQRRFGSQLHDGLCQELTAILVFAKNLTQKMEKEKTLELAELKKISDMLLDAVDQARNTARGLYPGELEGTSLMRSLEELASSTLGTSCLFYCPEPILIEDNNVATHLYRITQEAISNAVEHGKAQNIEVSFTQNKGTLTLAIKDDGIGIINDRTFSKGIGLKIMKYRARILNASFEIKSNSPQGVILECHFKMPVTQRSVA
ncbi:MAG: hypothetical protein HQM15_10065 [Deltaproteobacteria bacterium]|nr:hypothetical protein [Deltaproteobacteria bacterium]